MSLVCLLFFWGGGGGQLNCLFFIIHVQFFFPSGSHIDLCTSTHFFPISPPPPPLLLHPLLHLWDMIYWHSKVLRKVFLRTITGCWFDEESKDRGVYVCMEHVQRINNFENAVKPVLWLLAELFDVSKVAELGSLTYVTVKISPRIVFMGYPHFILINSVYGF